MVSEPDEAQLGKIYLMVQKFEFDDLDLPEYDEGAKADSVLDDIEQSGGMTEDQGVELDVLDLPEYGEDEAISDAFAEANTINVFQPTRRRARRAT